MTIIKITLFATYFGLGLNLIGSYMDRTGYHPMWPLAVLIWPWLWHRWRK